MIKHIWAVYFSPSGKTKQVTMAVAEGAAGVARGGSRRFARTGRRSMAEGGGDVSGWQLLQ